MFGIFKPGQLVEGEFCEMTGESRPSIRDALRLLESAKLDFSEGVERALFRHAGGKYTLGLLHSDRSHFLVNVRFAPGAAVR